MLNPINIKLIHQLLHSQLNISECMCISLLLGKTECIDMAESDNVHIFGVSNKLNTKINSFREVIQEKKLEVKRVCRELRNIIEKKEEELIRELDLVWKDVNAKISTEKENLLKEIDQVESYKKELEKVLSLQNTKNEPLFDISEEFDSIKREMDIEVPNVKMTWRVDELQDCIYRMCFCEQKVIIYTADTQHQLEWSGCERGEGYDQLNGPWGVAINSRNDNIYVADGDNDRIQIFSKDGLPIRCIQDNELKWPEHILFHDRSIYVQCNSAILKLNGITEKKDYFKSYYFSISGLCTDSNHIFVGNHTELNLFMLTLDLIEESRIPLKSQYCSQNTKIRDLSLVQDYFYILLSDTENPIQSFSKDGILMRCVVKNDSISSAYCFALDQQHNIIVADNGESEVKIFSSDGKILARVGKEGSETDIFSSLYGVAVDELGNIFTTDGRLYNKLQAFSPV